MIYFYQLKIIFLNKLLCFSHNTTNNNDNYDDTCYYIELKKDIYNLFN